MHPTFPLVVALLLNALFVLLASIMSFRPLDRISEQKILTLSRQLLRAEDITVIETVAGEMHAAIEAHVQQARDAVGYVPVIMPGT